MVFLTISKRITTLVGPAIFRTGLRARNLLSQQQQDTPWLDSLCGLTFAQKLISLAIYDESVRFVSEFKAKSRLDDALDITYAKLFGGKSPEDAAREEASIAELRLEVLDSQLRPAPVSYTHLTLPTKAEV